MRTNEKDRSLLKLLTDNNGYYDAENTDGVLVGPLVGYAATYDTPEGPKHFVGTRYWNFPRGAERNPQVMKEYMWRIIHSEIRDSVFSKGQPMEIDCAFGCPEGGIIPAYEVAREFRCNFSRADKKVIEVATEGRRERSKLIFGRHTVEPGWKVAIVEDVGNNFSTTDKAIELVEGAGATVVAIICMINRSPNGQCIYNYNGRGIDILQAVHIPTQEYRQDDPHVAEDVKAGRVVWKPKDNWDELLLGVAAQWQ